jgi:hypothetical protein
LAWVSVPSYSQYTCLDLVLTSGQYYSESWKLAWQAGEVPSLLDWVSG